jgi:glutaminyl-tRNA synthetase
MNTTKDHVHFIAERVKEDLASKKYDGRVATRFPPEPNGYLHMGHAKSICLNFGLARDYGGVCHLRMDDTNPTTEDMEYVEGIKRDVKWLGFDWGENMFYASDYYQRLYDIALKFIDEGKAYVEDLSEEEISAYRGTVTEAGKPSPYRSRSPKENRELFERMQKGEFKPGSKVLRAKGDLANPNMKMRDPLMYRIKDSPHYRTAHTWHVYPFYDFAHCFSDAFEGITHSICTLEFENNRELYDWYLQQVTFAGAPKRMPEQIEFARLNIDYTVLSKRKLLELVKDKHVSGWDDPRMPTLSGMRRRGYTPEAIRAFCDMIGIAKSNSLVDIGKLEFCVREDLNSRSARLLCVLRPLKVVIENWPEGKTETIDAPLWPQDAARKDARQIPMSKTLYIEKSDFQETPEKDFHRLVPGGEVRLRFGYIIKCERVVKDGSGAITELRCSYDPASAHGGSADGRKIKGIIHWVSAEHAKDVEVRLYDRLFKDPNPDGGEAHFLTHMNPHSLEVITDAKIEPHGLTAAPGTYWQLERQGFFFTDPVSSKAGAPVFNRAVGLKDSWTKKEEAPARPVKQQQAKPAANAAETVKVFEAAPTPALQAAREKLKASGTMSEEEAVLLTRNDVVHAFFDKVAGSDTQLFKPAAKWIVNQLLPLAKDDLSALKLTPEQFRELIALGETKAISQGAARQVLGVMFDKGGDPKAIVAQLGLQQVSDAGAIEKIVKAVLDKHPEQTAKLKAGEAKMAGFLVGQVMKESKGQANPQLVQAAIDKLLK